MSFTAALVVGWAAGNSASTILLRAIAVMFIGWLLGLAIGAIAQRTVDEHVKEYQENNPLPGDPPSVDQGTNPPAGEPA